MDMLKKGEKPLIDGIIHMGLDPPSPGTIVKGLHFETVSDNVLAESGEPIFEGASGHLPATIPWGHIQLKDLLEEDEAGLMAALYEAFKVKDDLQVSEIWSNNAGNYYCNEVFYKTVHTIRSEKVHAANLKAGTLLPATFVHLPVKRTVNVTIDALLISRLASLIVKPHLVKNVDVKLGAQQQRVLLTGFSGHLDPDGDPGDAIAEVLNGTCNEKKTVCYDGLLINYDDQETSVLKDMFENGGLRPYDAVIMLGPMQHQESLEFGSVGVELIAAPDGDDSALLPSTVDPASILLPELLPHSSKVFGNWSKDAQGTFANRIYYQLLKAIRDPPTMEKWRRSGARSTMLPVVLLQFNTDRTTKASELAPFVVALSNKLGQ
jgi:pyrrolidone-carboxylate peptidase